MTAPLRYRSYLAFWFATSSAAASILAAQERENDAGAREAWARTFREQRVGPGGTISPDATFHAWRAVTSLPQATIAATADASWRPLGPNGLFGNQQASFTGFGQLVAGRITSLVFHPRDGRTLFAGSASGGVWKTTNGGHSWTPHMDTHCSINIGSLAIDPVNPNLMYAGTGEINTFLSPGCGVLRSTDGGLSWGVPQLNQVGPFSGRVVVDPATAGSTTATTVLAATSGGLYVSANSGGLWVQRISGYSPSVVASPRPGTFYAAAASGTRSPVTTVWKSSNRGVAWTALPTPLSSPTQAARIALATSASAPDMVFALAGDLSTRKFAGLYRWNDAAQLWQTLPAVGLVTDPQRYPATFGEQADYDLVLAVDPRNANRIWVAGVGAFLSEDGGQTFRSIGANVHVDWHQIVFDPSDPDHVAASTDGGAYISYDGGRTFQAQNNGLSIAQFYPGVSVHPSGMWVYGGLQDNNAAYYTGSLVWHNLSYLGDGGYTAVNYRDPRIIYVAHPFLNFITRISPTGPEEGRTTGISAQDRGGQPRPLVMDPLTPSTLYFGTQRLYRSTNEGLTWQALTPDVTRGTGYITSIAVAPTDPLVIYVCTSDGVVLITRDGGLTFSQFVFAAARFFTRVAVDPNDPLHAIVTASTTGVPHATETRDGGATFFTGIGTRLPDVPAHVALFVPGTSTVMVGTDIGVVQTNNGGAQWTQGPPGLPTTIVHDLTYARATTAVIAATHGRGVFFYRVGATPAVLRGDVDRDGRVSAADALLIQQALVGLEISPTLSLFPHGDANCDGKIDGLDVIIVLRAAVGLSNGSACVGTMLRVGGSLPIEQNPAQRERGSVSLVRGTVSVMK